MSRIFTSGKIGALELKNRIIMPPMCMFSAGDDGKPVKFHEIHYGARALAGVGLIIVEATSVHPKGGLSVKDLGLWSDEQIEAHKNIVDVCHAFGSHIAVQINHAGRKGYEESASASGIPYLEGDKTPARLSIEQIEEIKDAFVNAAKRAKRAGYDAVELHAAHGFLLSEFLSPIANKRDDKYGGSLQNRSRFVLDTAKKIKDEAKITLIVRISAEEWVEGGWSLADSVYLAKELEKAGADAVHVSSGGLSNVQPLMPPLVPLYQSAYAKEIKKHLNIPLIAVGIITKASEAEALLLGDVCDFVAIGRELLSNPNFCLYAAKAFKEKVIPQYERGNF
ncbi:MAG: NADH:flavin oxidoreductase/NADH oxidase [Campylobacteraceae bacterium]|jgi:NADPH2 dehydrogenase|nr:NADH:flavin oxidoreductase/NADH oxidase [Campylobacteraceae bacterium]